MYRKTALQIISGALIFLFIYTACSKLFHFKNFQLVLAHSPLLQSFAETIAWALPLWELLISGMLFFEKTRKAGLYASLFTLITFTIYIIYILLFIPKLPCSCGGILQQLSWKQHCILNFFLIGLCITGLIIHKRLLQIPASWSPTVPYPNKKDLQ